jgi:hypothetical protein
VIVGVSAADMMPCGRADAMMSDSLEAECKNFSSRSRIGTSRDRRERTRSATIARHTTNIYFNQYVTANKITFKRITLLVVPNDGLEVASVLHGQSTHVHETIGCSWPCAWRCAHDIRLLVVDVVRVSCSGAARRVVPRRVRVSRFLASSNRSATIT